jgi:hypothetical protein
MLDVDAALAVMIPLLGDSNRDVEVVAEGAVGVGVEVADPLSLGARVRLTGMSGDAFMATPVTSAEPWVRLRFDPVQVTLRGTINLHGRDGLVGSRGPGFGVFLGAGVEI